VRTLNKEEKKQIVSELQGKFEKATGVVFTDYRGLNVEEIMGFRNSLRSSDIEYRVVKNTLAKRAAEGTSVDIVKDVFSGPIGIAVGYDDPVVLAKKVFEFHKSNKKLEVRGAVIEGSACSPEQLRSIAALPPREVQLSMLVGAMQAPVSKLVRLLNATLAQFAYAMEALKNKKSDS
jgi:large subunit ribosomal protein L10